MTNPSWDDAPEWAEFGAFDEDRTWWWYEFEPRISVNYWAIDNGGRFDQAETSDLWKQSLEPRPKRAEAEKVKTWNEFDSPEAAIEQLRKDRG